MNDLDLGSLFSMADSVGDKYLSPEEIAKRNAKLAKLEAEIEALLAE